MNGLIKFGKYLMKLKRYIPGNGSPYVSYFNEIYMKKRSDYERVTKCN